MKKLLLLCVYIFTLYSQSPMLFDDAVTKPNAYHIIELDCELFMVHMIPDMPTGSNYKVYNFPATINASGLFQLAGDITNSLTISANNVTLDMQGHTALGGITISSGRQNVTIKDGVIDVAHAVQNAVNVQGGVSQIALDNLKVRNAINNGIAFANVTDSTIRNCDLSSNTTGIQLSSSKNIIIENCVATANKNAGFDLISSVTCLVTKCKAMSTGQSNNQTSDQTIFGFVSANGNGNIFEQCIANGTQGLQVTDFGSMIAGFALRGDEACSKIVVSESSNAQVSASGVGQPVGILLEGQPVSLLTNPVVGDLSILADGLAWSPDGAYLAVGYQTSPFFRLYEFDYSVPALNPIINSVPTIASRVYRVKWHPSGTYIAVALSTGTSKIQIYKFDALAQTLTLVAVPQASEEPTGEVFGVAWTPDGDYLAAAVLVTSNNLRIYKFDQVTEQIDQVAVATPVANQGVVVAWSADGNYVAFGVTGASNPIFVYRLNRENGTITALSTSGFNNNLETLSLEWTADGKYLIAGRAQTAVGQPGKLEIYQFNTISETFSLNAFLNFGTNSEVDAASITPDGRFIVAGDRASRTKEGLFEFDRNGNITQIATMSYSPITTNGTRRIAMSPGGMYAAISPLAASPVAIFNVINFPSNNVIKNNTVYGNSGGSIPSGIGISGSSIANLIIGNTAYNNPIDPFMAYTNYAFVPNVFNPLFEQNPTALENIGITGPIQTPLDIALMAQQIESKLCAIQATITSLLP